MNLKYDIFCKVVDNFGDIGFCWRLAKELGLAHGASVRLWVDDWDTACALIPALAVEPADTVIVEDVIIAKWHPTSDFSYAADVVLETFACGLPEAYIHAMRQQQSLWLNIDHLSAEAWVDDFHAQISPQAHGLKKYFYFPGFTEKTGGLLRESILSTRTFPVSTDLNISLFAYPHAQIAGLFDAIIASQQRTVCYVPDGVLLPKVARYFGQDATKVGDAMTQENLAVHILPFLNQADYDALLFSCDINFVRGEDSWVRAIWAGKPFVWQPYWQEDHAHEEKLTAFLDTFYVHQHPEIDAIHHAWTSGVLSAQQWESYLTHLPEIKQLTKESRQKQMKQADLVTQLVRFCQQQLLSSS